MATSHEPNPSCDVGAFLAGSGEMCQRTRRFDWSNTALGPIESWPQSLRTVVRIMLDSRYAMWLGWGPEFTFFYNDAYASMTLGAKHPWALGRSAREVWSEIWSVIGPLADSVVTTGKATWNDRLELFLERSGFVEETYHTFSYSPVPDDQGGVGGMLCVVTEDTQRVIGERRLRTLRDLAARTTDEAKSIEEACQTAARILATNDRDVAFALFYLLDGSGTTAKLAGTTGIEPGTALSPAVVSLAESASGPWPLRAVAESNRPVVIEQIAPEFGPMPGGAWPEPAQRAVVLPLATAAQTHLAGIVVVGASPRRPLDDAYSGFLDLLAGQIASAVANARSYDDERRRAEALAELDRAKTAFFSNVSHEFRTPLTLMLGPVEELLARSHTDLAPAAAVQLEIVNRNGLRLLRLVNTLLDFSRIEAGRVRAVYQITDLSSFTTDLASNFRSACQRAGLRLVVDCPPLAEPAYVDRGMWEKIVLNLLSNAFKFTFEGEIAVGLRQTAAGFELRVRDTGTGVPAAELPRLFERFHRVENARGRTHEGSGIGLALVQELVKLHSGSIKAESVVGQGTTLVITIPTGKAHLPADQISAQRTLDSTASAASPFVEEALRWLPEETTLTGGSELPSYREAMPTPYRSSKLNGADRPRVMVVDDNADMRQYVTRLLSEHYRIEAFPDGEAALAAALEQPPELVLSDVMMPKLDGFGLMRALRANPRTRGIPILLLSARAGEESRVEGLGAGADDYLVKPFGARELLARVGAHLQMQRMRRESEQAIRQGEERFRILFETMTEGFAIQELIFDEIGGVCDVRFVEINPAFERHTGLKREQIEGRSVLELFPEADTLWFERFDEVARTGVPLHLQGPFGPIDRWFEVSIYRTEPTKIATVFFDITERRAAEERERQLALEAAQANAQFRAFFEQGALFAGIMSTDGTLIEPNRLCLDGCGYTRDQVVGKLFWECPWWNRSEVLAARIKAGTERAAQGEAFRAESAYYVADGSERMVDLIILPIKDDQGRVIFLAPTGTDITDRHRAEEALREANRRKDHFLATLAHELRNPLAPLLNGLQIMRLTQRDPAAMEQARAMMERQLGQMVHLIDDLLDVSRISLGKITLRRFRVELSKIIQQAVETSRPLIDACGHQLTVELPAQPIVLDADATRLAQVISNLLNNAAKYTEPGGRIALVVERLASEVAIRVRDNGVGIPPAMLPQVFEIFTQVDRTLERAQGGLGIGLSLVKGLVEMHGGSVEAHSPGPGQGSEFVVRLPRAEPAASQQPGTASAKQHDKAGGRRVLVVDDNRDAALSLALMLKLSGHDTRTANDGLEALEMGEVFQPEVVLLDIGMPRLNGYETAQRIRVRPWGRHALLVALTGWGQEEDRKLSQQAGFDTHCVKPIDPRAIMKLLTDWPARSA